MLKVLACSEGDVDHQWRRTGLSDMLCPDAGVQFGVCMPEKPNKYWFPAKRYGWGWGFPQTWEGWVVLAVYGVVLVGTAHFFSPVHDALIFSAVVVVATLVFLLVCLRKGEPPKWRWGKR